MLVSANMRLDAGLNVGSCVNPAAQTWQSIALGLLLYCQTQGPWWPTCKKPNKQQLQSPNVRRGQLLVSTQANGCRLLAGVEICVLRGADAWEVLQDDARSGLGNESSGANRRKASLCFQEFAKVGERGPHTDWTPEQGNGGSRKWQGHWKLNKSGNP